MGWMRLGPQLASHTDGYSVGPADRFHVEYVEATRRALIDAEFGGPTVLLYARTLHWVEGAEPELTPADHALVLARISEGLAEIDAAAEIIP